MSDLSNATDLLAEYADRGWCLLESVNKRPLGHWGRYVDGLEEAPTWDSWYRPGKGVSLICGPSRLAILDIDTADALVHWQQELGEALEHAPHVRTPKGEKVPGLGHYYFDVGDDPPLITHTHGFDLLVGRATPVVPPTPGYVWLRPLVPGYPLPPLPTALRDAHRDHSGIVAVGPGKDVKRRKPTLAELLADVTPEHGADWRGGRQVTLTKVAGHYARRAFVLHQTDYSAFETQILEVNQSHMVPPLPETDVLNMAARIWEAESNQDRYPYNDLGNAARLEHRFGDVLRYTPGLGDVLYDGRCWQIGATEQARAYVQEMVNEFSMRVIHLQPEQQKEARTWAKAAGNDSHLNGTLKQARPMLLEPLEAWDANPDELNTPAGLFDLVTAKLGPHQAESRCTKITRGSVVPSWREAAPTWAAFLDERFPDVELRDFILRILSLGLVGARSEKVMLWLNGGPDSGKSSLLEAVAWALGTYAEIMPDNLLLAGTHHDSEMVKLIGARFVYGAELNRDSNMVETHALDSSRIKRLTGEGRLTARMLYQPKGIDFRMGALLAMSSNDMPVLNRDDKAAWGRLVVVAMDRPLEHRDTRDVTQIYRGEQDGILTSLVAGWLDYQQRGNLAIPEAVNHARRDVFEEQNPMERWVRECVEEVTYRGLPMTGMVRPDETKGATNDDLYDHYREFVEELGHRPMYKATWGRALTAGHPEWAAKRQGRGPVRRPIRTIGAPDL